MRNKKLNDMLKFFNTTIKDMMKDPQFINWNEEELFSLAVDVCINEYSNIDIGKSQPPIGQVDVERVAFCISDSETLDLIFLTGGDFFDDEDII